MSITSRLILSLTLLSAVLWSVTAFTSRRVIVEEFDEIISANMANAAKRLMPLVAHMAHEVGEGTALELDDDINLLATGTEGVLAFEVRTAQGQLVLRSRDAEQFDLPQQHQAGYVKTDEILAYTLIDRGSGLVLTIFEPSEHRNGAVSEATSALFSPLLLVLPVLAALILALTRFSMSPIGQLRQEIIKHSGNNLSPLQVVSTPKELLPIAHAVDRLLERLRAALDAERIVAANSAHEPRTPIAGALAQTQQLKQEIRDGAGHERVARIEATLKKLAALTEKLLQLSRVDAGLNSTPDRQNMAPVLKAVVDEFAGRALRPARIVVQDDLHQDLNIAMDADAFAIVMRNLIENAVLHGEADQPIEIVISDDWSIHVINRCRTVPPELLTSLSQPYQRGRTPSDGSGLGLAIAERIALKSGGVLELMSPASGRSDGFEAVFRLP